MAKGVVLFTCLWSVAVFGASSPHQNNRPSAGTTHAATAGAPTGADERYRSFALALDLIHSNYIHPLSAERLTDDAIAGFYSAAGMKPPHSPKGSVTQTSDFTHGQMVRLADGYKQALAKLPAGDESMVLEAGIKRVVADLDIYSSYMDVKELRLLMGMRRDYGTIGFTFGHHKRKWVVTYAVPGSPAAVAGIRQGDRILSIGGQPIGRRHIQGITDLMAGKVGSKVQLVTERGGQPKTYILKRSQVAFPPAECRVFDRHVIYLRPYHLTGYVVRAIEEDGAEAKRLVHGHAYSVVLDLRGNPGGVLKSAVALTDLFLDKGRIAIAQGRVARKNLTYNATAADTQFATVPVTVLVDGGTSSGAEVVAAALQDGKRAVLVGSKTIGFGSVQTLFPLRGGALRLTTDRLIRPSGAPISDGIIPDVKLADSDTAHPDLLVEEQGCRNGASVSSVPVHDAALSYALEH